MPMVDQEAAGSWNYTSTVVTDPKKATCPAPKQDNECKSCRACWDKKVKNVAYLAH
jgi:epoxyqueuosine reductase QueG